MIFGKKKNRGIRLNGLEPEVVTLGENGITEKDLLVHNENASEPTLSYLLSRMNWPEFPVPVGVFYATERPCFEDIMENQNRDVTTRLGQGSLEELISGGATWTVT